MSEKAVFLDRDDTLIVDPGYISDPDQVRLIDGVASALNQFRNMGYRLVVISNQSAVARGLITEKQLGHIHARLKELLGRQGAYLDGIYYCPHHPEGSVPEYRKDSDDRKPGPGMLLTAAQELDIDLSQSWMIGDSARDIHAGRAAGCKTILVDPPTREVRFEDLRSNPDYRAINLKEAVNIVKLHNRAAAQAAAVAPEPAESPQPSAPAAQAEEIGQESTPAPQEPQAPEPQPTPAATQDAERRRTEVAGAAPDTEEQDAAAEEEPKGRPATSHVVFPVKTAARLKAAKAKDRRQHPSTETEASTPPVATRSGDIEPLSQSDTEEPADRRSPIAIGSDLGDASTEDLLREIADQLRILNRDEMFHEFSAMRFLAGIVQVLVVFCLVVTVWYLMNPSKTGQEVYVALGFAIVLQLMSLTFYLMQGRK